MEYDDRIYGRFEISEPPLLALMESRALKRLRGVFQHGISTILGITSRTSRFEHSAGVMLLVRRMGGSTEEQAAALLHDVSHTVLSHVTDFMSTVEEGESLHERVKLDYVASTDIPMLLERLGYDWRSLMDESRFPLLEQPAPALCADRLDYFLRDGIDLGLLSMEEVGFLLDSLAVHEGTPVMTNIMAAKLAAYSYIEADDRSWSNLREVGIYEAAARAIEAAIAAGAIGPDDLWGTDEAFWNDISACEDESVQRWVRCVSTDAVFTLDEDNPTFLVSPKVRTLDPHVLTAEGPRRLSEVDRDFARFVAEYRRRKSGVWPIRAECG